ncbi:hypothetical protein ACTXT7_014600 [Hymenolepis weldensis]
MADTDDIGHSSKQQSSSPKPSANQCSDRTHTVRAKHKLSPAREARILCGDGRQIAQISMSHRRVGPLVLPLLLVLAALPWVMGQHHEVVTPRPPESKNKCLPGWLPILFGCVFLFATWMANCTLLGGVFQVMANPGTVRVAYYFVGSQTIASLIYATLNLPPGLLILLFVVGL